MAKDKLTKEQEKLARFAKALGHPIRIAILQMQSKQTCCYHGDTSEILPIAKSTLPQHLKELKEAGLIQGKITPLMVLYCINKKNFCVLMCRFFAVGCSVSKCCFLAPPAVACPLLFAAEPQIGFDVSY
jgi:predicted transcriptional regulator